MKNTFNILSIFFLLFTFVQTTTAQEQVRATLDSTSILIGDQVGFHLQINNADGITSPSVDLSPLKGVPEIEIVKDLDWDTLDISGMRVLQKDLTITSFDSGYYFIPALSINYKKKGQNISSPTRQLALKVNTFPADVQTGEIAPIKDIIREPMRLQDFMALIIGLLALIAVVAGFVIYNRRKKAIEAPAPPPVIIPPHEIALTKLEKLKAAQLWQKGNIKEYQSSLTYIVREYLENRFNIQALEQTSDQILKSMKTNNIDVSYRTQLQEMFTMADLVKFAKAKPPEDANDKLMEYAENFVRQTKSIPSLEPIHQEPTIIETTKFDKPLASIPQRVIASIIDAFVLLFLLSISIIGFFNNSILNGIHTNWVIYLVYFVALIPFFVYLIWMESIWEGTVGQKLLGMKVLTEKGEKISLSQSFNRYIGRTRNLFLISTIFKLIKNKSRILYHDEKTMTRVYKIR